MLVCRGVFHWLNHEFPELPRILRFIPVIPPPNLGIFPSGNPEENGVDLPCKFGPFLWILGLQFQWRDVVGHDFRRHDVYRKNICYHIFEYSLC